MKESESENQVREVERSKLPGKKVTRNVAILSGERGLIYWKYTLRCERIDLSGSID